MAYCTLCQKYFKTDQALQQHTKDSANHNAHCDACSKSFPHAKALAQHNRDSPAHKESYRCDPCQQSFPSKAALNQHLQAASAHTRSPHACPHCTRSFTSAAALQQHSRDAAAAHARARAPSRHPCPHCARAFASAAALAQHARDAPHQASPPPPYETPLDAFFGAYATATGFAYDRAQPPSTSFRQLGRHMGWRRDDDDNNESREAWEAYGAALRQELEVWFGAEDDLANWHALCRAVGVAPLPRTCGACAKALRGRHVNLVDLLQWAREGAAGDGEGEEGRPGVVQVFGSVKELSTYCYGEGKVFPLGDVEQAGDEGDGNVVIRHLLRRLGPGVKGRKDSAVGFLTY